MTPGRYLIAAIDDMHVSYPINAGVFEKLRPLAVPITLVAGETAEVALGITKVAR